MNNSRERQVTNQQTNCPDNEEEATSSRKQYSRSDLMLSEKTEQIYWGAEEADEEPTNHSWSALIPYYRYCTIIVNLFAEQNQSFSLEKPISVILIEKPSFFITP